MSDPFGHYRPAIEVALRAALAHDDPALAGKIRWRIGFYEARAAKTP